MGISSDVVRRVGPIWPHCKISMWCMTVCQVERGVPMSDWWQWQVGVWLVDVWLTINISRSHWWFIIHGSERPLPSPEQHQNKIMNRTIRCMQNKSHACLLESTGTQHGDRIDWYSMGRLEPRGSWAVPYTFLLLKLSRFKFFFASSAIHKIKVVWNWSFH